MRLWRPLLIGFGLALLLAATTAAFVAVRLTPAHPAPATVEGGALTPSAEWGGLADDRAEHLADRALLRRLAQERAGWDLSTRDGDAPALRPEDPLLPAQEEVAEPWQPLDQAVREVAGTFGGRLSVVAIDLRSGARYEFRPHDRYLPASTFKLPVVICTTQAIDRGELTWESLVTFTPADNDTVGQGGFAEAPYGGLYPVRNLFNRSIISSNNVAVKMLARTLTWDGLDRCTSAIGGRVTRTEEGSTAVSAPDEAAWWMAVWRMQQERPALAANLLVPLRQVSYMGRIQAGTPRPELVTHKFGTYPPYEHDGAIIWGERPYILVVMSYGGDHNTIDGTIAAIAEAAWRAEGR